MEIWKKRNINDSVVVEHLFVARFRHPPSSKAGQLGRVFILARIQKCESHLNTGVALYPIGSMYGIYIIIYIHLHLVVFYCKCR